MSRAQQQTRTRAAVLTAARAEFAERGYPEAKIDRIAERAELTRGAVYSNFASKRSLYLAVLLDATPSPTSAAPAAPPKLADAAEAFARVWLERLPLATGDATAGRLRARSLTGVFDDERGRAALAPIARLEALLLAVALESDRSRPGRRVRLAELILTMLHGAAGLAESAPGFGDPFDVARACRHLAGLELAGLELAGLEPADGWEPPHLPYVPAARPVRQSWDPPARITDELSGQAATVDDGVVVVLGTGRLAAAEEAIRAARPGDTITLALVSDDPAETGALVRLRITDLTAMLRQVFGAAPRPVRLVLDDHGTLAAAAGAATTFETETAVRVTGGEIVARADGRGAAHAAAKAGPA
ncbi:TetR/AcrR family transcriptional regulator [Actinoplanes sp. M2I2]|uniref:TetR/AcrR family transcriptional regulator n=1 Tax=Actinoplanes sp. M2I2 TaxID=1734444 RepID=UPI0020211038|nr:TetR/AcrR family transcriptional regulator [Actinoplanes sp. M2I2]